MDIKVTYSPTPNELAKASSLFIEKKLFLMFTVGIVNVLAGLLVLIMLIKLLMMGLNYKEWIAVVGGLVWIFGRRPFNEWWLLQRMKRSLIVNTPTTIEFSRNGIIWSGKGLVKGNLGWPNVKYVMIPSNGLIIPYSATKFLWIPNRAFEKPDDIERLKQFIMEQKIVVRTFPKWEC